jgi:hypothetical protein
MLNISFAFLLFILSYPTRCINKGKFVWRWEAVFECFIHFGAFFQSCDEQILIAPFLSVFLPSVVKQLKSYITQESRKMACYFSLATLVTKLKMKNLL